MLISAPGKAMLCGEYAVLEGGTAVVAAVGRRVRANTSGELRGIDEMGPEVRASRVAAERVFGRSREEPRFDTSALFCGQHKLGLGSSAAASVAAAAAVAVEHGGDLKKPPIVERVFEAALAGHHAVAPNGSGADVAASAYGGFVAYRRDDAKAPTLRSLKPRADLHLSLVWTGSSARTSDLVARVRAFREANASAFEALMGEMKELSDAFVDELSSNEPGRVIGIGALYHERMRRLGDYAKAPIVTSTLQRIAEWAALEGGSAKPCGAGGGDVSVAFFESRDAREGFETRCRAEGFEAIDCDWGVEGVRRD